MDRKPSSTQPIKPEAKPSLRDRAVKAWNYAWVDVWRDNRNTLWVRMLKTVNLSVRTVLRADLQSTACALTYRCLLALVPALALLFAIGRGFGFQNLLTTQLFNYFPSQRRALEAATRFVDSYLAQASEGLFVGVGVVVLLWTLISLISSVEDAFNDIWGVRSGRSFWRKITDYTAIFIILPVLMVCGSGLTVFMMSMVQSMLPFMTPLLTLLLDLASVILIWLFFTGAYMLIPNAKVKFRNALPAGILAGVAYQVLQALFVNGQLYVSKYNAIYGGFAFLPLLLVWLQLVLLFTLAGAVVCYAAQNISLYTFTSEVTRMSVDYRRRVAVAVMAVMARRFADKLPPLTSADVQQSFDMPGRLVDAIMAELEDVGLINRVMPQKPEDPPAFQPSGSCAELTVGQVIEALDSKGTSDFVPAFEQHFADVDSIMDRFNSDMLTVAHTPILDIKLTRLGEHTVPSGLNPTFTSQI